MMFISLFRVSETYEIEFSVMYNCEKERMGKLIFLNLSTLESTSKSTFLYNFEIQRQKQRKNAIDLLPFVGADAISS